MYTKLHFFHESIENVDRNKMCDLIGKEKHPI